MQKNRIDVVQAGFTKFLYITGVFNQLDMDAVG